MTFDSSKQSQASSVSPPPNPPPPPSPPRPPFPSPIYKFSNLPDGIDGHKGPQKYKLLYEDALCCF